MPDSWTGAAVVRKGEPAATDLAHLRHRLNRDQEDALKDGITRCVRDGFAA